MSNIIYAFILSTVAGISTLIGFFIIYIKKGREGIVSKALGFACGVMLTISIIDLIPSALYSILKENSIIYTFILIIIGFLVGIIISSVIDNKIEKSTKKGLKLYKLGVITMIVIMLHNIPEGIVTFITTNNNIKLGVVLTIAIALHNIPEGISIAMPIYYSTGNKFKTFIYTFIAALSEPFGAIISYLFLYKYIGNTILGIIYAIIAGMMVNIAINELYKESIIYNKKSTLKYIVLGSLLMIINHILFN